uniref:sn-1-specific diacylglycerol lipase n=1 Tax=Alexandrium monilatum TaxID=311494 RepID=A0A7S4Q497_9DINO
MGEVGPILKLLYTKGYSVTIVGHSLGAAVASLLAVFLRSDISTIKAYCYGTPACVDWQLMGALLDCVVSVVNRDDVIPRLTMQNVQALAESALCAGQRAKTKAWMDEDWKALKDVERIAELRRRNAGLQAAAQDRPLSSEPSSAEEEKILRLCAAGVTREAALRALEKEQGDLNRALLSATEEEVWVSQEPAASAPTQPAAPAEPPPRPPQPAPGAWGFSGGSGNVMEQLHRLGDMATAAFAQPQRGGSAASSAPAAGSQAAVPPADGQRPEASLQVAVPGSKEDELPRFFIPGQVVHLYKQNGLSRAALASCTHEALTRIHPTPDMMEDHTVRAYDEALRQACIRNPMAPRWEAFEQRKVCACCGADFNWAYVLKSEPQRMLARVHCFSCGKVVCDGCSQNRRAHEQLGFIVPVRTCDSCFFSPDRDF